MGEVYSHLSEEERRVIRIEIGNGTIICGIVLMLGRNASTVGREIKRDTWFPSNENESYRVFCQVGVCVLCSVFPQCRQRVFRRVCGIGRCLSALCWLFGHEGVFASVGAALESDEPSVVDGAVDEGGGHVLVAEHASPSAEFDVGGVDDAPCLVAVGDDLEEETAAFPVSYTHLTLPTN